MISDLNDEINRLVLEIMGHHDSLFNIYKKSNMNELLNILNPIRIYDYAKKTTDTDRQTSPPNQVKGWLNAIMSELSVRPASPKYKEWYNKNYIWAGYPSPEEINTSCYEFQGSTSTCSKCSGELSPKILYPNYNPNCLDSIIDLFIKTSDRAVASNRLTNSRFMLYGNAGEGKSSWINNLLSVKQDSMWRKKLINIKVNITDPVLHGRIKEMLSKSNILQRLTNFIRHWIYLKLLRILNEYYFTCETSLVVYKDFSNILSNDEYLKSSMKTSVRGDVVHYLTYSPGNMTQEHRDYYLKLAQEDARWKEIIENLFLKSQSTLTLEGKDAIFKNAVSVIPDEGKKYKAINEDLGHKFGRERFIFANEFMMEAVVQNLIDYGYRFLIIIDGIDPHHNLSQSEEITEKVCEAVHQLIYVPKHKALMGTYLIAMRSETISRYFTHHNFLGSQWGGYYRIKLARTDPYKIIQHRLSSAAKNYTSKYYKEMAKYILGVCAAHINKSLHYNKEIEEGVQQVNNLYCIADLYRGNRRKALVFFKLYLKEIYLALDRYGELDENEHTNEKRAENNAKRYLTKIFHRSYLFWNPVIYRDTGKYTLNYTYKKRGKKAGERSKLDRSLAYKVLRPTNSVPVLGV